MKVPASYVDRQTLVCTTPPISRARVEATIRLDFLNDAAADAAALAGGSLALLGGAVASAGVLQLGGEPALSAGSPACAARPSCPPRSSSHRDLGLTLSARLSCSAAYHLC